MAAHPLIALVLWYEQFNEVAAAIFVSGLRAAGHQVRLVGIGASGNRGKHGLRLVPDTTISEALTLHREVALVVVPSDGWSEPVATYDPRVRELMVALCHENTRVVVSAPVVAAVASWLPPFAGPLLNAYPTVEGLIPFVRDLAFSLSPDNYSRLSHAGLQVRSKSVPESPGCS